MTDFPLSLLIVDGDQDFATMLAGEAEARAFRARRVATVVEALDLIQHHAFDAVLVDLAPGAESAFELLAQLKRTAADTEVIVMSNRGSMAATIPWFDPDAFAFVRKSDLGQLFAALARALEHRRITAENRRLVWELQTINEIASSLSRSLELNDVLTGALQRLVDAMDASGGSIRLRDELTGVDEVRAAIGPPLLQQFWAEHHSRIERPSHQVIATSSAVVVEDFAHHAADQMDDRSDGRPLPLRSAISVPMLAGNRVIGTLSLGSAHPRRFQAADRQLLATIAGQIVVAVQNAQLHQTVWRAKREWEQTFDAISDPIAVFNDRGELLRGNRALAAHLSVPITEMRRLTCSQIGFCGEKSCPDCGVGRALRQLESRDDETLRNGQIFSVTTFPIGPSSGGPSAVQVAKNVTEEIRGARHLQQMSQELTRTNGRLLAAMNQLQTTQAQLVQAEKLSALGQLVSGVAHELNNPLTCVIGYAQLLEEKLREGPADPRTDDVSGDLRRIAEESERAARIVRNLLAFARRQRGVRSEQSVAGVCARVLALRAHEQERNGVAVTTDIPDRLPQVFADEAQLQQVLLNLVLNAEQALRGQDLKTLSVRVRPDDEAGILELSVTDSGHGIEAAHLSRIFDPFFTTRVVGEGTGLGLSVCHGIVRDHGGHIRVDSTLRVGTTVRVMLPARLADPAVGEMHVLVAHPEQSEREFLAAALRGWGYHPVAAATRDEALDGYLRPPVRIALVDPSLMVDNLETWRRVRATDVRHVAMILTASTPDHRALERFGREEASAVLMPPFELRALRAAVRAGAKECV